MTQRNESVAFFLAATEVSQVAMPLALDVLHNSAPISGTPPLETVADAVRVDAVSLPDIASLQHLCGASTGHPRRVTPCGCKAATHNQQSTALRRGLRAWSERTSSEQL